jgi:hypothetical protein
MVKFEVLDVCVFVELVNEERKWIQNCFLILLLHVKVRDWETWKVLACDKLVIEDFGGFYLLLLLRRGEERNGRVGYRFSNLCS